MNRLTNLRSHSVTMRIRKTQVKKENWKTEKSSSQPPMSKIHMKAKLVLHSHHNGSLSSVTTLKDLRKQPGSYLNKGVFSTN